MTELNRLQAHWKHTEREVISYPSLGVASKRSE